MNLLIDTHAVIWFITEDSKLPLKIKKIIENTENNCFVSIATYWEIAIKHSLGRLNLDSGLENIFRIIEKTGFEILPITTNQILINASLPHYHQDPFDRIIIAQAIQDDLKIVTKDGQFKNYQVSLIWE
ncbi:MAG: type II toxin-antitoxin system VapC family toxin [Bacteroidetes bacterium]|nr:MAG: type II toxin-antitoxin system VapC family toxin [Bacteroidota bacterium]